MIIKKKNILKKKIGRSVGRTSESGGDLECLKNKKCNQTLYFCVCVYMNYFNKVVYVMYIRVESNNIKATIIKSNVQKNNNQKKQYSKTKSVDGQTSESGEDLETQKNKKCNQTMYFCVLGYMNYFIKIINVMYIGNILVNIKM